MVPRQSRHHPVRPRGVVFRVKRRKGSTAEVYAYYDAADNTTKDPTNAIAITNNGSFTQVATSNTTEINVPGNGNSRGLRLVHGLVWGPATPRFGVPCAPAKLRI